jgi:hypothetical protein
MLISLLLVILSANAHAADCEVIGLSDIVSVEPPAVIVLGERPGLRLDSQRALRVVTRLQQEAPVTLALEAVHERYQPILDRYAAAEIDPSDLPHLLGWEETWGFDWSTYEPLVTAAVLDVDVVAAGLDLGTRSVGQQVPIPPRYVEVLRDAMAGADVPMVKEGEFIQAMAWRDHRIAELATGGWDGEGYLVVLADRLHVEGRKGVSWQLERLRNEQVEAFVLAWATPPCYAGDQVWRPGIFERLFSR